MKFPRINKQPEDVRDKQERGLGTSRRIFLDLMVIASMLFRPPAEAGASIVAQPPPEPTPGPPEAEKKLKLIKVGKHLQQYAGLLNPWQYFAHRSHSSHSSHSSHRSHSSHSSHYSSAPPPARPPAPTPTPQAPVVTITATVNRLTVTFRITEASNAPSHDVHFWNFGDHSSEVQLHSDGHTITHVYGSPGVYVVVVELRKSDVTVGQARLTLRLTE